MCSLVLIEGGSESFALSSIFVKNTYTPREDSSGDPLNELEFVPFGTIFVLSHLLNNKRHLFSFFFQTVLDNLAMHSSLKAPTLGGIEIAQPFPRVKQTP